MTVDWTHELLGQFDVHRNLGHGPSLETLTGQEYLWEPVPGMGGAGAGFSLP